LKIPKG